MNHEKNELGVEKRMKYKKEERKVTETTVKIYRKKEGIC